MKLFLSLALAASVAAHKPSRRHHSKGSPLAKRDDEFKGVAYYGYQNGVAGSCGGKPHDDTELLAGLETSQYGPLDKVSPVCGKHIKVSNNKTGASVIALIHDSCTGCSYTPPGYKSGSGSLYLSVAAFKALGDLKEGAIDITWTYTEETTGSSPAFSSEGDAQALSSNNFVSNGNGSAQPQQQAPSQNGSSAPQQGAGAPPQQDNRQPQQDNNSPAPAPSTDGQSPAPAPPIGNDNQGQSPAPPPAGPPPSGGGGGSVGNGNGGTSNEGWRQTEFYQGQAILDNFDAEDKPCDNNANCHCRPYSSGLAYAQGSQAVLSVDGRQHVDDMDRGVMRLISKRSYNVGSLIIVDVERMPVGCGQWPALFMVSRSLGWAEGGEIDLLEAANHYSQNVMSVHTSDGCYLQGENMRSTLNPTGGDNRHCSIYNSVQACGATSTRDGIAGHSFNNQGGGVFAVEISYERGVRMHVFKRNEIPGDILGGSPNPSSWGQPDYEVPSGSCNPGHYFRELSFLIVNTMGGTMSSGTFNNAYAGNSGVDCGATTGQDPWNFIKNNGGQLRDEGYWVINSYSSYSK